MPLEIQSAAPDIHVAALVGELDANSGQDMVTSIKQAVRGRNESIILDSTRLRRMDMGGFRGLLSLLRWAENNEARIIIAGMAPDIWQMIVDNHCGDRFEQRPSVPAALGALGIGAAPAPQAAPATAYSDYPEVDPYGAPAPSPQAAPPARDPWAEMNAAPTGRGAAPGPWDQPAARPAAGAYSAPAQDPWAQQPASPPPANDPWAQPAAPANDPWAASASPPPVGDPWAQAAAPSAGGDWGSNAGGWGASGAAPGANEAWDAYEQQGGYAQQPQRAPSSPTPAWRKPMTLIIAGSLVAMVVLAWFLIGWMRPPVITLTKSEVEVPLGSYPSEVTVTVAHGTLDTEAAGRVLDVYGLGIMPPENLVQEPFIYTFNGTLKGLDKARPEISIPLTAVRGSKTAQTSLTVKLQPRDVRLAPKEEITISAGTKLPSKDQPSVVAQNASSVTATWNPAVTGLTVEELKGGASPGEWQLSGTALSTGVFTLTVNGKDDVGKDVTPKSMRVRVLAPVDWAKQTTIEHVAGQPLLGMQLAANATLVDAKWYPPTPDLGLKVQADAATGKILLDGTPPAAGAATLRVTATAGAGSKQGSQDFTIKIAAAPNVPPPDPGTGPGIVIPPSQEGIDPDFKIKLLSLIERAPTVHFTSKDKDNLRIVVEKLTEARRVAFVRFGNGSSTISPQEKEKLQQDLEEEAAKELLGHHDCQVFIIGFASLSGSVSTNIRLSKQRAAAVNREMRRITRGKEADLCGDYGPTDVLDAVDGDLEAGNRAVAVYAGKLALNPLEKSQADEFKTYFNREHGTRE